MAVRRPICFLVYQQLQRTRDVSLPAPRARDSNECRTGDARKVVDGTPESRSKNSSSMLVFARMKREMGDLREEDGLNNAQDASADRQGCVAGHCSGACRDNAPESASGADEAGKCDCRQPIVIKERRGCRTLRPTRSAGLTRTY